MKKYYLIVLCAIIAVSVDAQITQVKDSAYIIVAEKWEIAKVYNNYVVQNIPAQSDSIIYEFTTLDDLPNYKRQFSPDSKMVGDTLFNYTDNIKVKLSYARRIVVYRLIVKSVKREIPRSNDFKMWNYVVQAKSMNASNSIFYNHPLVQGIVNNSISNDSIR